ncbi:vacuolar amino acid transporter 1 [[Candida] railenensis]|uniref:Vacuolar amino acid transporter 1 n=1 Tax=[Candida] railenensis TaxID=45579 RepID=A0A9P0QU25_9ASCO|nr:vacuolar amino acid transporter 1 [[Candida] railenensis]
MTPVPVETKKERRTSFLDAGGPNSINNFASSYVRTQSYWPHSLGENSLDYAISPGTSPVQEPTSSVANISAELDENQLYLENERDSQNSLPSQKGLNRNYEFPNSRSNGTEDETSPLIPVVSAGGKSSIVFEGSTTPQTIFNAINTMMGIGMLSLPMGFKLSGWVFGTIILTLSAASTNYTAKLLGKILKIHPSIMSYSDIAYSCYGSSVNILITLIFTADLIGATASLVLLFGDSFAIFFPEIHTSVFKTIIICLTFISSFLPLSILSMSSLLGVVCTSFILLVIIFCGVTTTNELGGAGGSLLNPVHTYMWPQHPKYLLVSLGIFMAPWGGHVVFPELYRDMRHPYKYNRATNVTFNFTFFIDYVVAAIGFLMFGVECQDSFTKNLMLQPNYPRWVKPTICLLFGVLALVKAPLLVRPVFSVLDKALGIQSVALLPNGSKRESFGFKRAIVRFLYCAFLLLISITFTSFGGIIAFLGSAICFTICLVLPLMFYRNLYYDEISRTERKLIEVGIVISTIGAIAGTYGSIAIDI